MRLFKRKSENASADDTDIAEARARLEADKQTTMRIEEHAPIVSEKVAKATVHRSRNGFTELFKQGLKGA